MLSTGFRPGVYKLNRHTESERDLQGYTFTRTKYTDVNKCSCVLYAVKYSHSAFITWTKVQILQAKYYSSTSKGKSCSVQREWER